MGALYLKGSCRMRGFGSVGLKSPLPEAGCSRDVLFDSKSCLVYDRLI